MNAKMGSIIKKWWVLALVIVLTVFLTSCSSKKKNRNTGTFGFTKCDGTLGGYDLYTAPAHDRTGIYRIIIVPVPGLVTPGNIVSMAVASTQTQQFLVLQTQAVVNPNVEINVGEITKTQLLINDRFIIQPYEPGVRFDQSTRPEFTSCNLPLPPDLSSAPAGP